MSRATARIVLVVIAVMATFVVGSIGIAAASIGLDLSNTVSQVAELSSGLARQVDGTEALIAILPSTSTSTESGLGLLMVAAGLASTAGAFVVLRRQQRSS